MLHIPNNIEYIQYLEIFSFDNMFGFCVSRNFYIVVVPLKRKSSTIKNLINPDEMDMEEVGFVKRKHARGYRKRKHARRVPNLVQAQWFRIGIY